MEDLTFIEAIVYGVSILMILILIFSFNPTKDIHSSIPSSTTVSKNFKLYTSDGVLLKLFENVYPEYYDRDIYKIYEENEKGFIARIHKGENMMIVIENHKLPKEEVNNV